MVIKKEKVKGLDLVVYANYEFGGSYLKETIQGNEVVDYF